MIPPKIPVYTRTVPFSFQTEGVQTFTRCGTVHDKAFGFECLKKKWANFGWVSLWTWFRTSRWCIWLKWIDSCPVSSLPLFSTLLPCFLVDFKHVCETNRLLWDLFVRYRNKNESCQSNQLTIWMHNRLDIQFRYGSYLELENFHWTRPQVTAIDSRQ